MKQELGLFQRFLLAFLGRYNGQSMPNTDALAKELKKGKSTMKSHIKDLEQKGYIELKQNIVNVKNTNK